MTILPLIDLRLLRAHVELFHRAAASFVGRDGLLLRAAGLDPSLAGGRPQPLPLYEERFAFGDVQPMTATAIRWNREPGRNLRLAPVVTDLEGGEVLGIFGFIVELAREPGWLARVPIAPSGAVAAGDRVWAIYLLERPEPAAAVMPAAQAVHRFVQGGDGPAIDFLSGCPLAGGIETAPSGAAAVVELEPEWRGSYRLEQLPILDGGAGPKRVTLGAISPEAAAGAAGNAGEAAEDDDEEGEGDDPATLGRFVLGLHARARQLEIGSDVEIAQRIARELVAALGETVFAEGEFWHYGRRSGCWSALDHELTRRLAHAFDGAIYTKPNGRAEAVQLSKHRIDSIAHELAAILAVPEFFAAAAVGLNCGNGFLRFTEDYELDLVPHRHEHRQRHVIPGKWDKWAAETAEDPPEGSLLGTLLKGCFDGDVDADEKCKLVAELIGAAAGGYATKVRQPKATILKGDGANNGKSQVLDLLRSLLPAEAVVSLPASKFSDPRYLIHLRGKLLNASDESSSARVVASDIFKAVVTGEPLTARDVYKSAVPFRAIALHVFAANVLPSFTGGFDRGVRRRLGMLVFNRIIPPEEQILDLGRRIAAEEPDLLLAFAVAGLQRLIRQRAFTEPPSSVQALEEWFTSGDPVAAWAAVRLRPRDPAEYLPGTRDRGIPSADVFADFDSWQKAAGYRATLQVNGFSQRLHALAPYVRIRHRRAGSRMYGIVVGPPPEGDVDEDDDDPRAVV